MINIWHGVEIIMDGRIRAAVEEEIGEQQQ